MAQSSKNLILNKEAAEVTTFEPSEHGYMTNGFETQGTEKLTDGKYSASTSSSDQAFHAFYRCAGREIVYELDELSAITGFKASFLIDIGAGVYAPRYINLYVSENGEDYMLAYTIDGSNINANTNTRKAVYSLTDGVRYKAKYIKISFDVLVNTRCDELEVYGGDIDGSEAAFVKDPDISWADAYDAGLDGLQDMVLIHTGCHEGIGGDDKFVSYGESYVNTTEEMFLPYVAYVDKNNNIVDTMFDSVLFISLQGLTPSGGLLYYKNGRPTVMSDWTYFASMVFSETSNMRALDNTVKTVKDALGLDDYKVSVTFALPYAQSTSVKFGDINGDGIEEGCSTLDERAAIYDWYMDYVLGLFDNGNYENLTFGGFYWTHESIVTYGGGDEIELIKRVGEKAHALGTNFLWIPLYLAPGFEEWDEYGFDCAYMQPNYITLANATHEMLGEFAQTIKKHGMAVELEMRWGAVNAGSDSYENDASRYENYLKYGVFTGYMTESAHAYYQGANPGYLYDAAKSSVTRIRALYDNTYKFIKGTYELSAPVISGNNIQVSSYDKKTYGYVKIKDSDSSSKDISLIVVKNTEHGELAVSNTGDYSYLPNEGYNGIDTFTIQAFDGFMYSEELTITISVGDVSAEESDEGAGTVSEPEKAGKAGLYAALAGLAVIAAGAFICLSKKKKNKK